MGADLILYAYWAYNLSQLDWEAGRERARNLTFSDLNMLVEYSGMETEQEAAQNLHYVDLMDQKELRDWDARSWDVPLGIDEVLRRVRVMAEELVNYMEGVTMGTIYDREVSHLYAGPVTLVVTGGMSGGDDPTLSASAFQAFGHLELNLACGFGERPKLEPGWPNLGPGPSTLLTSGQST